MAKAITVGTDNSTRENIFKKISGDVGSTQFGPRIIAFLNTIAVPVLLLALWQILSGSGLLLDVILPSPVKVVKALFEMIKDGSLGVDLAVSGKRVLIGYLWGAGIALILGVFSGLNKIAERVFSPVINVIRQIPLYAWMPLIILWFGIGEVSKEIIIARGVLIPIYLNTLQGIKGVQAEYFELAEVLELKRSVFLRKVVLPSAVSSIFTGLRLGAGNAWMAVVAAEMLGGLTGLGYALMKSREFLWSDKLIALMVVIGVIGVIIDVILHQIEIRSLKWKRKAVK
ncbi:MAG: ABC transporter permease [Lachnospiraceae bacterium]|nr:ABC transporter permease [Lachnospiraceae bacterium]